MLEHKIAQLEERLLQRARDRHEATSTRASSRSARSCACATSTRRRPSSTTSSARPRRTRPSEALERVAGRHGDHRPQEGRDGRGADAPRQQDQVQDHGDQGGVAAGGRSSGAGSAGRPGSELMTGPAPREALPRPGRDRGGPRRVRAARGRAVGRHDPPARRPRDGAARHGQARLPRPRRPLGPDPADLRRRQDGRARRPSSATWSASTGSPAKPGAASRRCSPTSLEVLARNRSRCPTRSTASPTSSCATASATSTC